MNLLEAISIGVSQIAEALQTPIVKNMDATVFVLMTPVGSYLKR